MKHYKIVIVLGLMLVFTPIAKVCAACDICNWRALFQSEPKPQKSPEPIRIVSEGKPIGLQNPYTREIARCYDNNVSPAEECAKYFEKYGFVRFREIPYKTANYDFLQVDTYPTRRWRDSELTSRW